MDANQTTTWTEAKDFVISQSNEIRTMMDDLMKVVENANEAGAAVLGAVVMQRMQVAYDTLVNMSKLFDMRTEMSDGEFEKFHDLGRYTPEVVTDFGVRHGIITGPDGAGPGQGARRPAHSRNLN